MSHEEWYLEDEIAELRAKSGRLNTRIAELVASNAALSAALSDLLEPHDESCRIDHNGNCQAHYIEPQADCCVANARAALAANPKSEAQEGE